MPLSPPDLTAARRSMLFEYVPTGAGTALLDAASAHSFEPGSILFREGERASCLYVLLEGVVGLGTTDGRANAVVLEFVKPGQPFLMAALLLGEPYVVTATVLRASRILAIPGSVFHGCLTSDLEFSNGVNKVQSRLRRGFVNDVKGILTKTAIERLAEFLLTLIDHPRGQTTVTLPCDRQILASWLGILPSSISRVFRQLEEFGVEGRSRALTIRSVERLRKAAGQSDRHTPALDGR